MDIKVKATLQGTSITISENREGIWVAVHRPRGFTSAHFTRAQIRELRDALTTLLAKAHAAQ